MYSEISLKRTACYKSCMSKKVPTLEKRIKYFSEYTFYNFKFLHSKLNLESKLSIKNTCIKYFRHEFEFMR